MCIITLVLACTIIIYCRKIQWSDRISRCKWVSPTLEKRKKTYISWKAMISYRNKPLQPLLLVHYHHIFLITGGVIYQRVKYIFIKFSLYFKQGNYYKETVRNLWQLFSQPNMGFCVKSVQRWIFFRSVFSCIQQIQSCRSKK